MGLLYNISKGGCPQIHLSIVDIWDRRCLYELNVSLSHYWQSKCRVKSPAIKLVTLQGPPPRVIVNLCLLLIVLTSTQFVINLKLLFYT